MNAAELRKKLDEGLKVDNSGKSTPMQRLTPFLQELVTYLEEHEGSSLDILKKPSAPFVLDDKNQILERDHSGLTPPALFGAQVSSDDATRAATAQTNSESDGAPKEQA